MFDLPLPEMVVFILVVVIYIAAAVVGVLQLLARGEKYKRFLLPLVSLAITLEAVILIFSFARRKLKRKELLGVLGKIPNIEKLERLNLFGLKSCFILMTFGLASGIGLAATSASLNMTAIDWITDPKIVLIAVVWLLLGAIMMLWRTVKLKEKIIAHMTIVAFALILAIVGTSVFCGTEHDFAGNDVEAAEQAR